MLLNVSKANFMLRPIALSCLFLFVVAKYLPAETVDDARSQVAALTEKPYCGTLDDYPAYAMRLGDEILALVEPLLKSSDLSSDDKKYLTDQKHLGLIFRYGFDEAEYDKKYEVFLESVQDYPRYRRWIAERFYKANNEISKLEKEEQAKAFSELVDRWAPSINKYFIDEKRIENEQLPTIIVEYAERFDPDGSLGLIRTTVEKLRPVLEADVKRTKHDLLRYCAQSALNSLRRLDMAGKPMEFKSVDVDDKPVDVKNLKGKVVLIVTAPYQWEQEKIVPLHELAGTLKKDGLEIILYSHDNPEIARQKLKSDGAPWIVTTRYGNRGSKDWIDYAEHFGTYEFAFLVDREGTVVRVRADKISPVILEGLKPLFPEQSKTITEIVEKIRGIDDDVRKKSEEDQKKWQEATDGELPVTLKDLIAFQTKIATVAPPKFRLPLIDLLLSSDALPAVQHAVLLYEKLDILADIAREKAEANPEVQPEIMYREVDALADELLKSKEKGFHHNVLFRKMEVLYQMQQYLKKMKTGQAEYAQEITNRFLAISKQAPDSFWENLRMHAMFFLNALEDIDAEYSTQLSRSYIEQVIPVFAASKNLEAQQEARRLENVLRRLMLPGTEMEFETMLIDGSKVDVKELRGKVVLVNFWNTQCGSCLKEFPHMKTLYEKYKPQGYEMIAYSCGDDLETLQKFVAKTKYPWLTGSLLLSKEKGLKDYNNYYGITGNPTTMILDRSGKVRFMTVGSDDAVLARELEKRFAEEPVK